MIAEVLTRISHKDMPSAAYFSKSLRRKSLSLLDVSSGYAFVAKGICSLIFEKIHSRELHYVISAVLHLFIYPAIAYSIMTFTGKSL